eukprot:c15808_g1_i1 orf=212-1411(-)
MEFEFSKWHSVIFLRGAFAWHQTADDKGDRRLKMSEDVQNAAPHDKPPFTLGQLKKAVPRHCFKRFLMKSGSYLAVDLLIISSLFYARSSIRVPGVLNWALWIIYWIVQGCMLTSIWVMAHECGHHAFSDYAWVDDLVGLILHSCLLVPYFSFKYSHRRHHSNTQNVDRDEVYVPSTNVADIPLTIKLLNHPVGRILRIVLVLTMGWPCYLLFNCAGRNYGRFTSHFDPNSPIFNNKEKLQVIISDLAILVVGQSLYQLGLVYGFVHLLKVYWIPLQINNGLVVLITYLQHTHPSIPYYNDSEWEWLRGTLCTVDRDWGFLNLVFHHSPDTHVIHHIFPTIPHYHAVEATNALKPILGKYYQLDRTPVHKALIREFTNCIYVEPNSPSQSGILWFRKLP